MSNYASYDGVPSIADHHLLTDILRTEWGYQYWVTSDAGATDRICQGFKMCQSVPLDHAAITLYVSHKEIPCSVLLTVTGSQRRKRRGNGWRILQF
jgi:hypothetical protein